ncbi:MAG: hypothetical protein ACRCT7_07655 [Shewanella sp.]
MLQKLLFLPMSVVKWIAEVVIEVLQLDKSEAKEREHQILLGIQSSGLALAIAP